MGIPAELIWKPDWKERVEAEFRPHNRRDEAKAVELAAPAPVREQDDSAEWLAWKRGMDAAGPGFVACEIMPNWLNKKVPGWVEGQIRKMQRRLAYEAATRWREGHPDTAGPFVVTITRYGPNTMDDDGNTAALKRPRDGAARALGIDDGDEARIRFVPGYVWAKFYGFRVEIKGA